MEKFDAQKTQKKLQTVAKNIILFVGGGMNVDTIGAARIQAGKFEATRKNQPGCGEEHELSFDKFPYSGFCKTYSLNSQTPSSRSAGTGWFFRNHVFGEKPGFGAKFGVKRASIKDQRSHFSSFKM